MMFCTVMRHTSCIKLLNLFDDSYTLIYMLPACLFQGVSYWSVQGCDCSQADLTGHRRGGDLSPTSLQTGI